MAYTISITYTEPTAAVEGMPIHPIAPEFALGESYVDDANFRANIPDSAYSRNIWEKGDFKMAENLDEYLRSISEHPGVALALKSAVIKAGTAYEFQSDDYKDKMYYEDLGRKLEADGFKIEVTDAAAAAAETKE